MECPECKSKERFARKYAGFYASVDDEGDDCAQNFSDHQSSTELGDETICYECGHEFIGGW